MPKYRNVDQDKVITAQQWNKPGDVPSWAYGIVKEFDDSFEIPTDGAKLIGSRGDYIFKRDSGEPGLIRRVFFELNYRTMEDAMTGRVDLERYAAGTKRVDNFFPKNPPAQRPGYQHIPLGPLNSPPYNVHSLCIFKQILFACSDKGLLRFDEKKQEMVHIPFHPETAKEVPA